MTETERITHELYDRWTKENDAAQSTNEYHGARLLCDPPPLFAGCWPMVRSLSKWALCALIFLAAIYELAKW